jgi:hypothetical protein
MRYGNPSATRRILNAHSCFASSLLERFPGARLLANSRAGDALSLQIGDWAGGGQRNSQTLSRQAHCHRADPVSN